MNELEQSSFYTRPGSFFVSRVFLFSKSELVRYQIDEMIVIVKQI
ncbi:MAG: hypothetical protein UT11_C0011G0005 [Berkelbacteria bacterium GW2011_GWA2_38_9]|uniref:Uncharacterized protein n=1 Tax=Berkelbacteria bacterium GW2011_GWA2_38_9 TaxID=1618334 RepID=A0A0G0LEB4_9BACT|nr:MAG: hypothetical protein UT11_C0011G0005 [Berkelbacteria bacterium GW2011_GWA2_38_9]